MKDDKLLQDIPLNDGDQFMYNVSIVKRPFTFEFNKLRKKMTVNVDLKMGELKDYVITVTIYSWNNL